MTARRELTFLLADPERRLLRAIATRLPGAVRPNHLTCLGVLGALGASAAYGLSTVDRAWLWAATGFLVLNWFGDSLDGTLARVRGIERPRYGYYLDHLVDAFATVTVGIGIGLSPYVDLGVALGLVVAYLVLSINIYLESSVFGVFRLAYGRIGPTETRLILIGANLLLALLPGGVRFLALPLPRLANAVLVLVLAAMLALLIARFARNLTALAKLEPQRRG